MPAHDREACVLLPVLGLQLLWRRRPHWRGTPVAVVADESPESPLLLLSREAQQRGLRPGLRQGAARNLVPDLRTGVVKTEELEAWTKELVGALRTFSPRVERDDHFVGCFFVDPNGLSKLYGGVDTWAKTVHQYFQGRHLIASVVVGFRRYRCQSIARQARGPKVLDSAEQERKLSDQVPLRQLGFPESLCEPLAMLDVSSLGDFLSLPVGELKTRFGTKAAELHHLFSDQRQLPMQPESFDPPRRIAVEVNPPAKDRERLLFYLKTGLDKLLGDLHERGERLTSLSMTFDMEPWAAKGRRLEGLERLHEETLEPASPLDDASALLELVRLRMNEVELPAATEQIVLEAASIPLRGDQLRTATERPKRDRAAAARALARVRATFGDRSVCRAQTRSAHLPEAQFRWAPLRELPDGEPRVIEQSGESHEALLKVHDERRAVPLSRRPMMLQRRLLRRPRALGSDSEGRPALDAPVVSMIGPHRLSGGWWGGRAATERDYYFAETEDGGLFWVYWDVPRSRWYLHGHLD